MLDAGGVLLASNEDKGKSTIKTMVFVQDKRLLIDKKKPPGSPMAYAKMHGAQHGISRFV
jgi:hypothetical protein